MLESHIVAVLTKETQHLILIGNYQRWKVLLKPFWLPNTYSLGDHQQLRPTTSVYKLAKLCHMDISLFERMINNHVHCTQLTVQHRMRPEIANLIRPHIYKELQDHESVLSYPKVIGLQKNLFFINHNHPESSVRFFSRKTLFLAKINLFISIYRTATNSQRKIHLKFTFFLHFVTTLFCRVMHHKT